MKSTLIQLFFLVISSVSLAQNPGTFWAKNFGTQNNEELISIKVDDQKNQYILTNGQLKKLDSDGNLIWEITATSTNKFDLDNLGNIYLFGGQGILGDSVINDLKYKFKGSKMQFVSGAGNVDLPTTGSCDLGGNAKFIGKLNSNGQIKWIKRVNINTTVTQGIMADGLSIPGIPENSCPSWTYNSGLPYNIPPSIDFNDIGIDSIGNCYISGKYTLESLKYAAQTSVGNTIGTLSLDFEGINGSGIFILKLDSNLNTLSCNNVYNLNQTEYQYYNSNLSSVSQIIILGVTKSLNPNYTTNYFTINSTNCSISNTLLTFNKSSSRGFVPAHLNKSRNNIFFASDFSNDEVIKKTDINGGIIWTKSVTNFNPTELYIDNDNSIIYLAGDFINNISFNNKTYTSNGDKDAIVLKYDFNGNEISAFKLGEFGSDYITNIELNSTNDIIIGGYSNSGTLKFGSIELTSFGGSDTYIFKLCNSTSITFGSNPQICINVLPVNLNHSSPAGGYYQGNGILDSTVFSPDNVQPGRYPLTYVYTNPQGCKLSDTGAVIINNITTSTLSNFNAICANANPFNLSGGSPSGGNYFGNGINSNVFTPSAVGSGQSTISYIYTNQFGCKDTASNTIFINALPDITMPSFPKLCEGSGAYTLSGAIPTGGSYTGNGVFGGKFYPSAIGVGVGSHPIIYSVQDANSCTNSDTAIIEVRPKPNATFNINHESYFGACNGNIKANTFAGTGTIQAVWLDNQQNPLAFSDSIGSLCPGNYTLELNDQNNCSNSFTKTINPGQLPQTPDICLVSVDSTFTHNIVVWEKTLLNLTNVDSFIVYRELTTNNYVRIGAIHADSLSEFEDFNSNPNVTGYRYKITMKDIFGIESLLSLYHNTIYLNYLGNGVLSWTQYQVENSVTPVSSYEVYRDSISNGNFRLIGNTTGNQFGFTDVDYLNFDNASYFVKAVRGAGECIPSRARIATSRSNVKNAGRLSSLNKNNPDNLFIYPNPSNDIFYIESFAQNNQKLSFNIFDSQGKLIESQTINVNGHFKTPVNISHLSNGIYHLQIQTNAGLINKKIIKQ